MRGTIYTCTVQSGRHNYQISDLHRTVIESNEDHSVALVTYLIGVFVQHSYDEI